MTRRNFLANALKAYAAAQLAPIASVGANSAATAILKTAGTGIGHNTTMGEAIFWLNQTAIDNAFRAKKCLQLEQMQTDFYFTHINRNPFTKSLLKEYTPSELWNAYKESSYGGQLSKTDPLSDDAVIKELSKVIEQAKKYKKEESSPKKENPTRQTGIPPNWVKFASIQDSELRARTNELCGNGYYYR